MEVAMCLLVLCMSVNISGKVHAVLCTLITLIL